MFTGYNNYPKRFWEYLLDLLLRAFPVPETIMIMFRYLRTRFFLFFFFLLFAGGCQESGSARTSPSPAGEGETQIILLTVNDMHSQIDRFPQLYTLVQRIRSENSYVFLLAAGDLFTGNPVVDRYPDKGAPVIELMNIIGFDAACFGNHEFDLEQTVLSKRIRQAKFPFVCANIKVLNGPLKQPEPFVVLKAGPVKIAVLGLLETDSEGHPSAHPDKLKGLIFSSPLETATLFRSLKGEYGVLVALTHIGNAADRQLAGIMPEIDVIVGGHSHTRVSGKSLVQGVLITQAESHLKYVGETILTIQSNRVIKKEYRLLDLSKETPDPALKIKAEQYSKEIPLNSPIAYAKRSIPDKESLGSMMADALVEELNLDVAFQNRGGVRLSRLPAGIITLQHIFTLDPFDNRPIVYNLYPKEIRSLIENAYSRYQDIDLFVGGITYTLFKGTGKRVRSIELKTITGDLLNEDHRYKVGMNSYIASTYAFEHKDPGSVLEVICSDILANFLTRKKTIDYYRVRRAFLAE